MSPKLDRLKEIMAEVADVHSATALLSWDQQTYMPAGGNEARGHHLATLSRIRHELAASDEVGKLIADLKQELAGQDESSDDAATLRVAARDYHKESRVPADFIVEQTIETSRAFEAWHAARARADFSIFRPHLERVVELARRYVTFFPPADHPYDVLLDDYEPGMKTADVRAVFGQLRPRQVELIKAIAARPQVNDRVLHKKYNEGKIWDFSAGVTRAFGYDWTRGRMDKAAHPFENSFSVNDVRITNRSEAGNPLATVFSAMHEAGHAMYEQGIDPAYDRTVLAHGTSLAVHESQSRMWENLVGRSLAFWEFCYPKLKAVFPSQLEGVGVRNFYKAINRVEPSFIRVNADEATYNMHIMLRLELEIAMLEGDLAIKDLPELWNTRMQEYLGITPANDALGVLQDIHWSAGMIGYFSTYALGNLISVQLWEKINKDIRGLEDQIRKGKFDELLGWLHTNVHRHGRKYEPQDLVQKVTGSRITPEPYIRYLTRKYSEIYGL
ncbi:MAG TPA: carboxypeptidase M32 [Anaerolineales bacterium]|nr:carboxypeptidase M32 [Anaerolineales bacterium]